ncbi:MAG: hypothetical protein AABY89_05905 [Acidobacteriota bacterium]
MTPSEIYALIGAALQGVGVGVIFPLALFIGICIALTLVKLRPSGPSSLTVRSLDEALGEPVHYLTPDKPRGTMDQLDGSRRAA